MFLEKVGVCNKYASFRGAFQIHVQDYFCSALLQTSVRNCFDSPSCVFMTLFHAVCFRCSGRVLSPASSKRDFVWTVVFISICNNGNCHCYSVVDGEVTNGTKEDVGCVGVLFRLWS